jgi:hypothetical protein
MNKIKVDMSTLSGIYTINIYQRGRGQMYGTTFTMPVGKKVLAQLFGGNMEKMFDFALRYRPKEGGPEDLGVEFRNLVGTRNRTDWWKGAKIWLSGELKKTSEAPEEMNAETGKKVFTRPVGEKVLENLFQGDIQKMYEYACHYVPGVGGPYPLGEEFRSIIKTVNRERWWKGCRAWLENEKMLPSK